MPGAQVISVNRGREADLLIGGKPGRSAIAKRPTDGQVAVRLLGLDGDEQADKENHGGVEQAAVRIRQGGPGLVDRAARP